jgi:predicted PurR-regulated permease PerM
MTRAARFSYFFILVLLVLMAVLHMATPLITILFSYFALCKLDFTRRRWVSVLIFLVLVSGILYGLGYLLKQAVDALPKIADESIPSIITYLKSKGLDLPFDDVEGLKASIKDMLKDEFPRVGNFARAATREFLFILIGVVVAASLFLNPNVEKGAGRAKGNNLFTSAADEVVERFRCLYESFQTVIGAQLVISAINTALTTIFVLVVSLRHPTVVIGLTFLFGFLPIVGNLISNAIIVGIAFTISPRLAIASLIFLIGIHKLEYFLNSKIIGDRIKNPVWLTLLALVLGERLMGIGGMILAPVILNYVKVEASKWPADDDGKKK